MFQKFSATLNDTVASDRNLLYLYQAYIKTILNIYKKTYNTRLISKGWAKDTAIRIAVCDLAGANTGVINRATRIAISEVVILVGRPHLDIFYKSKISPPRITLPSKLMFSTN